MQIKREEEHDDLRLALACVGGGYGGTVSGGVMDNCASGFQQIAASQDGADDERFVGRLLRDFFIQARTAMKHCQETVLSVIAGISLMLMMGTMLLIAVTEPIYPFNL